MPRGGLLYRRSPHIVSYWADGRLVFHNYASGVRIAGTALTIGLLDYFNDWRPAAPLLARSTLPVRKLQRAVSRLVDASLLQQAGRPMHPSERGMEQWADWNPAAGFFHFSTKDMAYLSDQAGERRFLLERIATRPIPPGAKTYRGYPVVKLPRVRPRDHFSGVLLSRRTWRSFGQRPLPLSHLSALMQLTFGAQKLIDLGAAGPAMLRTSPSAGARNPIEAYIVARRISGLSPGLYHYSPFEHRLVRLKRGARSMIARHLPGQPWYADASLLVLMTAVFGRTDWKYPYARAYRAVLLEAGHFCQTFCLTATALGLAPFCTAALADSLIEHDLGLDGVTESVVYACGVGTRPPGVNSAPWPDARQNFSQPATAIGTKRRQDTDENVLRTG
jgi:SagB-type dehydrogenase family enzyme